MPKVVMYLYKDAELIEALGTLDILRRCEIDVITVAQTQTVELCFGVKVQVDKVAPYHDVHDAIIIPGGPGWANVQDDTEAMAMVNAHVKANKVICAICAAPSVTLGRWGYLDGKKATCYPTMESIGLTKAKFCEDRVVVDGNFITSRGPGTSLEFAFAIAEKLGSKLVNDVK